MGRSFWKKVTNPLNISAKSLVDPFGLFSDPHGTGGGGGGGGSQPPGIGTPEWLYEHMGKDDDIKLMFENAKKPFYEEVPVAPEFEEGYASELMSAGRKEADIAAGNLRQGLAGRGAGGLGSALSMSAASRSGSVLDAVSRGAQLDVQKYGQDISKYGKDIGLYNTKFNIFDAQRAALVNALTFRYNMLNQIMGAKMGQEQANLNYMAAKERTEAQKESAMFDALGNVVGAFGMAAMSMGAKGKS